MSDDHSIKPSIPSLAAESYLDAETADVNFVFPIEQRVPAHKILLKFRSDVFNAMFYGQLKETGDVQIVDTTVDIFKEFLKIFYFDKPNIEMAYISGVLELVRKYNVAGCLDYFDNFLCKSATIDKFIWIYDLALEFEMPLTKSRCDKALYFHATEIFQSSAFLEMSYEMILRIVSLENLACDEYTIFSVCILWAQEVCHRSGLDNTDLLNLRLQLRDILYQIRFRSMDSEQLVNVIKNYHSLFTNDELADIALIALKHSELETSISQQYRNITLNDDDDDSFLLSYYFHVQVQSYDLERLESVTFTSDKQMVLKRILLGDLYRCWKKISKDDPVDAKLLIIKKLKNEEEIIFSTSCSNELTFGEWFTIPKLIRIEPLVEYEICLEFGSCVMFYRARGRKATDDVGDASTTEIDCAGKYTICVSGRATAIPAMSFSVSPFL